MQRVGAGQSSDFADFNKKKWVILVILTDLDTNWVAKTLSFPKGIVGILRKSDFLENQDLNSLAFQVLQSHIYPTTKPETLVIPGPDFEENPDFAK